MASILVTTTPQSVRVALGVADGTRSVAWLGECQNIDPTVNVYRERATAAPTGTEAAFRHPPGDRWAISVYSDDLGPTWLWTSQGTATVVLSDGIPGV